MEINPKFELGEKVIYIKILIKGKGKNKTILHREKHTGTVGGITVHITAEEIKFVYKIKEKRHIDFTEDLLIKIDK